MRYEASIRFTLPASAGEFDEEMMEEMLWEAVSNLMGDDSVVMEVKRLKLLS